MSRRILGKQWEGLYEEGQAPRSLDKLIVASFTREKYCSSVPEIDRIILSEHFDNMDFLRSFRLALREMRNERVERTLLIK